MAGSGRKPNLGETSLFEIVRGIRDLFEGRSHAVGQFTLALNQTTTVVQAINCGPNSVVSLSPRNAAAAGALATTYISAVAPGQFTVTHASAGTSRIFDYALQG